jgi:hypothetical protein
MALSTSNREADLRQITQRLIGEQIQEYFEAWGQRAMRGQNLRHPVPPELAIDARALSEQSIAVRLGDLSFQTPDEAGYVPFPLSFVCTSCELHRECRRVERLASEFEQFRSACPSGSSKCANDWMQVDVVLAHWSGEVEPVSPSYRYWASGEIKDLWRCASCEGQRFFLRRPPGPLANWHFECVECHTVRPVLQRDLRTLEALGPLLDQNQALIAEINMEPVSYRASAAYYSHGDRLLVFNEDTLLTLLGGAHTAELQALCGAQYGYPPAQLTDGDKAQILESAGRLTEWHNHRSMRELLATLTAPGMNFPRDMIAATEATLRKTEDDWNATVFVGHQQATPGIAMACNERSHYVRRFDPVRMMVEHETLVREKLRGGQMSDGKEVSVDVTVLDPFLMPDGLSEPEKASLKRANRRSLDLLGVEEMRLIRDVRICEYTFGYTRTSSSPTVKREKAGDAEMPVRLRLFDRVAVGDAARHPVLCLVQANEGFYVRLREETVLTWLSANSIGLPPASAGVKLGGRLIEEYANLQHDDSSRFTRFLDEYRRERAVPRSAYPYVYTLLHTMAHHIIGAAARFSGLDLGSFGEHLFVPDLAMLVYRRGMTMDLGNLSSMWRDRGDIERGNEVLDFLTSPPSMRCGSETVCNHRGGACPDCILIPETSCLTRNELLSRSVLVGRGSPRWDAIGGGTIGYYDVAATALAARKT